MTGTLPISLRALAISVGVGLVLAIIIGVVGGIGIAGSVLGMLMGGGGAPAEVVWGSFGLLGVTALCLCCGVILMLPAQGVLYAGLAHRFERPLKYPTMMLGGALAPFVTSAISQTLFYFYTLFDAFQAGTLNLDFLLKSAIDTFGVQLCLYSLLYIPLGAAGAALYVMIMRRRQAAAEPAAG